MRTPIPIEFGLPSDIPAEDKYVIVTNPDVTSFSKMETACQAIGMTFTYRDVGGGKWFVAIERWPNLPVDWPKPKFLKP